MGLLNTTDQNRNWKSVMRGASAMTVAVAVAGSLGGCDALTQYFNLSNSFLDPSQVGRFDRDTPWGIGKARPVVWPILDTLGVLDEPQMEWTNATDPTPADLVSKAEEQTLQPGDAVRVSIFELLQPGQEAVTETRIDDLGILTVKNLGKMQVTGLTSSQLETKISQMLIDQQILPAIPAPQVNVLLLDSRSRVYYLMGSASRPGTYNVLGNDFRLLEALALAGDIPVQPGMDYLYILRQTPYEDKPGAMGTGAATNTGATAPAVGGTPGGNPLDALQQLENDSSKPAPVVPPATGTTPTGPAGMGPVMIRPLPSAMVVGGNSNVQLAQADLEKGLGMPATTMAPATMPTMPGTPATVGTPTSPAIVNGATTMQGNQPFTRVDGKWVPTSTSPAASGPTTAMSMDPATPLKQTRVIKIPIKELREGVSKYNIVIRPGDIINVPSLDLGEFYMMGNIARPGVYSLTGRKITLKQAVAAGGNLGPLALPARCELIRRIGPDQEATVQVNLKKIFDGTQPDIFLKPNDILNVGTDAIEPFFAVTRNAYRASYGWGFIYDQNFHTGS